MSPALVGGETLAANHLSAGSWQDSLESCGSSTDSIKCQPFQACPFKPDEQTLLGSSTYQQIEQVGQGTFGTVIRAVETSADSLPDVAIKLLPRGATVRDFKIFVRREILHQSSLQHPFIIAIKEVFLTRTHLAIAMEYAPGGDLYQHVIARKPFCRLPEDQARWLFQQLLIGLDYCHRKGVANRDLKLENLLLDRDGAGTQPLLKICDFGYSKHDVSSPAKTTVGTPVYMAPEIIMGSQRYDAKKADLWSCGVILFALLFGRYPFDTSERHYIRKMVKADYTIPEDVPVSAECKELVQRLLVPEPSHRVSMVDILAHPWFLQALPEGALAMNDFYLGWSADVSEMMQKVDSLIEQSTQVGSPGDDLSQAHVIVPKVDLGTVTQA